MKKVLAAITVMLATMLLPSIVLADPIVSANDIIIFSEAYPEARAGWDGGAFKLTDLSQGGASFDTFCLEVSEDISFGVEYTVGDTGNIVHNNGGTPIALSDKAAYLFFLFDHGVLSGFNSSLGDDHKALQEAIWYYQSQPGFGSVINKFTILADAANPASVANFAQYVYVINPISHGVTGAIIQNQSVLGTLPVPEPGTLILVGMGLVGLGIVRRRK